MGDAASCRRLQLWDGLSPIGESMNLRFYLLWRQRDDLELSQPPPGAIKLPFLSEPGTRYNLLSIIPIIARAVFHLAE